MTILAYFWWTPVLALIAGLFAFYGCDGRPHLGTQPLPATDERAEHQLPRPRFG